MRKATCHVVGPSQISVLIDALSCGELAVLPTDTIYGVAADARNEAALALLFEAKGRDRDKPVPLLACDVKQVRAWGAVLGDAEERLAVRFWPGALTLVLDVQQGEPQGGRGVSASGREGFRVPDCALTLEVLARCGGVLRVTSANRSGEPPAQSVREALAALGDAVRVALDGGPVPGGTASTVVRMVDDVPRVLREGAIPAAAIDRCVRGLD